MNGYRSDYSQMTEGLNDSDWLERCTASRPLWHRISASGALLALLFVLTVGWVVVKGMGHG